MALAPLALVDGSATLSDGRWFAPPKREATFARKKSSPAEPRVLLLTSSLGSGHARAAQAIEAALLARRPGAQVTTLDFWSLIDEKVAWTVRSTYLRLVHEYPVLFDRIYRLDQHMWRAIFERSAPPPAAFADVLALMPSCRDADEASSDPLRRAWDGMMLPLLSSTLSGKVRAMLGADRLLRRSLVQVTLTLLTWRLVARVKACAPDAIVATQMNSPALMSLARRQLRVPTIAVPTDFGLHDFWIQPAIGHYCVAHDSIDGLDAANVDAERVSITGIPLMPGFANLPAMAQARRAIGLDPARPAVLVVGGGLGLGVKDIAHRLVTAHPALQVLVVTGRNDTARDEVGRLSLDHPGRLHVHDWTDHMEVFMRAADIVVGKPGGLTVAETLACGRPLLATRALGGQESFNVRFLERHRVGRLVEENRLGDGVMQLLADDKARRSTGRRAWSLGRRDGADRIARLVESVAARRAAVAA